MIVRVQGWVATVGQRLRREQEGLTAIEYGVFAAFVVLMLVVAAVTIGPKLSQWLIHTIDCIIGGNVC
jgi:Flp pilus assembly pilin Flp